MALCRLFLLIRRTIPYPFQWRPRVVGVVKLSPLLLMKDLIQCIE